MLGSGAAVSCTAAAQLGSQASRGTASTSSAPSSGDRGSGAPGSGAFGSDALRSGVATHSDALRMYGTSDFGVSGGVPQQQQPRSAVGAWRGAGGGAGGANTYPMLSTGAAGRLQTARNW